MLNSCLRLRFGWLAFGVLLMGSSAAGLPSGWNSSSSATPSPTSSSALAQTSQPISGSNAGSSAVSISGQVRVRAIRVHRDSKACQVEILLTAPILPRVTVLESPARIVMDLPNTQLEQSPAVTPVCAPDIRAIRLGHSARPQSTRLVVDLDGPREFSLKPSVGKLVLVIGEASPPSLKSASLPNLLQSIAYHPSRMPMLAAASMLASIPETVVKPAAFLQTASPKAVVSNQSAPVVPPPTSIASNLGGTVKPTLPALSSFNGDPVSVNLRDVDLKDFFRLIHEVSGLNIVLDPTIKGTITLVLDAVPWDQALDLVLRSNDLAAQREGNLLRVTTADTVKKEAESRRATQEAEALAVEKVSATRFLSYARAKDVVNTVKKFLSSRGDVIADDRTNAIIITDIPSTLPAVDALLKQLDQKTQEVEIEARVVAATRTYARDIGTQLGFGFGNSTTSLGGTPAVGITPGGAPITNPLYGVVGTGQIPLFSNLGATQPTSGINFTNATNSYRIDAVLTMAESRGLLKILSRPRVVTQNNIQAVVKQGVRLPIVTLAQLQGPPTVNYVDAFLRLTVTPQITSEGTIFLNVDVENTTPDFSQMVNGNPALLTQQATTQILVTDGGTVVIGGVIQTTNSVNSSQVPLLGDIPYLGNLFKRRTISTSNQELIFFITPRIIRT